MYGLKQICFPILKEAPRRLDILKRSLIAYGWGSNDSCQISHPLSYYDAIYKPVKIKPPGESTHATCGYGTTYFYEPGQPSLFVVGLNNFNQLGVFNQKIAIFPEEIQFSSAVRQVSAGRLHVLVLTDNGIYVSGSNSLGQCGLGGLASSSKFGFVRLHIDKRVKKVAAGFDHTIILDQDGRLYSCGWSADGQTGSGHYDNQLSLSQVVGPINKFRVTDVSTCGDSCLALTADNTLWGWGNNEYGQLTCEVVEEQAHTPLRLSSFGIEGEVSQVASGGSFSLLLSESRDVYVCGFGALGLGADDIHVNRFHKMEFFDVVKANGDAVKKVIAGPNYAVAITERGMAFTWGRGAQGVLGTGDNHDEYVPVQIPIRGNVVDAACGVDHVVVFIE